MKNETKGVGVIASEKSRQQRILDVVRDYTISYLKNPDKQDCGVQTVRVAEKLGLNRANVSRELNSLYSAGQVIKLLGKPTLFLHHATIAKHFHNAFIPTTIPKGKTVFDLVSTDTVAQEDGNNEAYQKNDDVIIGLRYSLRHAFQHASAAVTYPPHGLHVLLTGGPGNGLVRFAKTIHEYAIRNAAMSKDAPFVMCDCRQYQTSPQMLLGQLFGEGKNSASTTSRSRRGLLERASGGILCLEGVHTLDALVQERLCALLENRTFSRFREADVTRFSNALIIAISALPADAPAIASLAHSIPVHISISNLTERSVEELLSYVAMFFQQESAAIGVSFRVDKTALHCLLSATYPGNIDELRNVVKAACAMAYQDYAVSNLKADTIGVSTKHLSADCIAEIKSDPERTGTIQRLLSGLSQSSVVFSPGELPLLNTLRSSGKPSTGEGIPIILCCHGEGIAEKTASYINRVYGAEIVTGLSYSSGVGFADMGASVARYAQKLDRGYGVLIAADMEPLGNLREQMTDLIDMRLETITCVDLPTMLSLSSAALHADFSVHELIATHMPKAAQNGGNSYLEHSVREILMPSLTFLNPSKATTILLDILYQLVNDLSVTYNDELAIKFIFHCSHMLERLIRGTSLRFDQLKRFTKEHTDVFSKVETRMKYLGDSYGVVIPAGELAYITEIFLV